MTLTELIEATMKAHDESNGTGVCVCGLDFAAGEYDRDMFCHHRAERIAEALNGRVPEGWLEHATLPKDRYAIVERDDEYGIYHEDDPSFA